MLICRYVDMLVPYVNMSICHPFRLFTNVVCVLYMAVVPLAYGAIYGFRRENDRNVPGIASF